MQAGITELATAEEARQAYLGDPEFTDPAFPAADTNAARALSLESISGIREGVLEDLELLQRRYSRIYVHPGVVRSSPKRETPADYDDSNTLEIVWKDIRSNRDLHEIDGADWPVNTIPPEGSDAAQLGRSVMFKDLSQAFEFLEHRSPIGKDSIEIFMYGGGSSTGNISYSGLASIHIMKGPSEPGVLPQPGSGQTVFTDPVMPVYRTNGKDIRIANSPVVSFADVYFDFSQPNARGGQINTNGCGLTTLWNFALVKDMGDGENKGLVSTDGRLIINTRTYNYSGAGSETSFYVRMVRNDNGSTPYRGSLTVFSADSITVESVRNKAATRRRRAAYIEIASYPNNNCDLVIFQPRSFWRYTNYSRVAAAEEGGLDWVFDLAGTAGFDFFFIQGRV